MLIAAVGVGFPVSGKQMCDIITAVLIFGYSPDYILQPVNSNEKCTDFGNNEVGFCQAYIVI